MDLTWFRRPLDDRPGTLNLCYNAVDVHVVRGRAADPAFVHDGTRLDFAALLEESGALAGALRSLGIGPGSLVADAGLGPGERLVLLLALLRLGGVHTDGTGDDPALTVDPQVFADEIRMGRHDPAGCADLTGDAPALLRDGRAVDHVSAPLHDDWAGRALRALITGGPLTGAAFEGSEGDA